MSTKLVTRFREVPQITEEQRKKIDQTHAEKKFLTEKELRDSITAIRNTVKNEELRLRKQYAWLEYQNSIGGGLFLGSLAIISLAAYLFLTRAIHWALAVVMIALPTSILHELEHDLIHNLYFKSYKWIQHTMFFTIWMIKMSIPPWLRKILHLRHHVVSGQKEDIEERLIGLGLPARLQRFMVTFNAYSAITIFPALKRDNPKDFHPIRMIIYHLPTVIPMTILWTLFFGYIRFFLGFTFTRFDPAAILGANMWLWPYVRDVAVLFLLPNILRQSCLNLMATYCHYFGDVPNRHVYYQNQIIDHWLCYPFQLFCFNFGCTHIIHHYVPNQPFYLRQMLAPKAIECLLAQGVRRNDFGIVTRSNRFFGVEYDRYNDARSKEDSSTIDTTGVENDSLEADTFASDFGNRD